MAWVWAGVAFSTKTTPLGGSGAVPLLGQLLKLVAMLLVSQGYVWRRYGFRGPSGCPG